MKLLFALMDQKTETFLAPLAALTRGEAERTYIQILRQEGTQVNLFPQDFPLYEIGTYDELTGMVCPILSADGVSLVPRLLVDAATVLQLRKEA